jgi:transcriptional regulator with XRE-family HTH domain
MPTPASLPPFALKIRHFRWQRHLSRRRLADLAGVRVRSLLEIEEGRRKPGRGIVEKLAGALGRDPGFLLSTEKVAFTHHLRALPFRQETKRLLNRFEQLCQNYGELRKLVRSRPRRPPRKRGPDARGFEPLAAYARRLAAGERRRLRLEGRSYEDFFRALEEQGSSVLRLPFGRRAEIDGAALFGRSLGAFILVNSSMSPERQAFAAAHEYCHHLKDRKECFRYDAPPEIHDPKPGRSPMVTVANAFAAEFIRGLSPAPQPSSAAAVSPGYLRLAERALRARKITRARFREFLHSAMA